MDQARPSGARCDVASGSCAACTAMRRLDYRVCRPCIAQHVRRAADLRDRVRGDRDFARIFYLQLSAETRPSFVRIFGYPFDQPGH
jgi:hypothetical protein